MACAGGDGTLMNLIEEAVFFGCKVEDMIVSILPYGTGNDLAQTLGWGFSPKYSWAKHINLLAKELLEAQEEHLNLWDISVILKDDGKLM